MKIIEKIMAKQTNIYAAPPITIAFLGDSVTQGCFEIYLTGENSLETVFDYENSIASNLKHMLNLLYPNVQFNIINSGLSGDSAPNGLSRFDRDIAPFSPDLVVVGYALNDSGAHDGGIEVYKTAMNGILSKIKATGAEAVVLTPNMMNTHISCHLKEKLFRDIAESTAVTQNGGYLDKYSIAACECAMLNDAQVCDVYSLWKTMFTCGVDVTELLANKINHPIRELNKMTAFKLLEVIMTK